MERQPIDRWTNGWHTASDMDTSTSPMSLPIVMGKFFQFTFQVLFEAADVWTELN